VGAYHRRNKDDYAFDRFAPLGPVHPFQHTTWQDGASVESRWNVDDVTINARAEVLTDFLKSTSLTAGNYHSRTLTKLTLVPEESWSVAGGGAVMVKAGATYDDSNRDGGTVSPVAEISRTFPAGALRRVYASYAQTTQEPSYTALNSSASSGLFRGNPDLGRETTRNLEVGVSGMAAGWSADAAVFARRDLSLVDWTFTRGVTARSANAVDVDTLGVEAVLRRSWRAVDLVFGYTALAKDPDYRGARVDASFYALNYARQRLTAAATVRLGSTTWRGCRRPISCAPSAATRR
jgi:outer membrane cobalamin receptor